MYHLPWYIVIGSPGSGKTTVLSHSGLDFPYQNDEGLGRVSGIAGTRACDWWVSNEALFIDTAGRYTTQDSHQAVDRSAWRKFLHLLKHYRRRRPINGVLLTVSVQDILLNTEEERILQAKKLRARLDELQEELEVGFPVYLVFTKCDLIAGFSDFFENLSASEREQVWGLKLPIEFKNKGKYQHVEVDLKAFKAAFTELAVSLSRKVMPLIQSSNGLDRHAAVINFPIQFGSLTTTIDDFIQQVFGAQRHGYHAFIRGVYFTSAIQEGVPIDRVTTELANNFGFERKVLRDQAVQAKHYFLRDLINKVIFPEAGLVGLNSQLENFIKWGRTIGIAALGVVFIGFTAFWLLKIDSIKEANQQVVASLAQIAQEKEVLLANDNRSIEENLPSLDAIWEIVQAYQSTVTYPFHAIGSESQAVQDRIQGVYHQGLREILLPSLMSILNGELALPTISDESLLQAFRVYLMLHKPEHLNVDIFMNWWANVWSAQYGISSEKYIGLKLHLLNLLEGIRVGNDRPFIDDQLVNSVKSRVKQLSLAERVYDEIKVMIGLQSEVDLSRFLVGQYHAVFDVSESANNDVGQALRISSLYTKAAYENIDLSPESNLFKQISEDNFMFSLNELQSMDEEMLGALSKEIRALYIRDYSEQWHKILLKPHLKHFHSLQDLEQGLSILSDSVYSPMVSFLKLVKLHTYLPLKDQVAGEVLLEEFKEKSSSVEVNKNPLDVNKVNFIDQRFTEIGQYTGVERLGELAELQKTLNLIDELRKYLHKMVVAEDHGETAYEFVRQRFEGHVVNDPIGNLLVTAKVAPEPIKTWLIQISEQSWESMLTLATEYISSQWKYEVYDVYNRDLKGRYPLDRGVQEEVPIEDFSAFFKAGGVEASFVSHYLTPFIDTKRWRLKKLEGKGLSIKESTLWQLRNASEIRKAFFRSGQQDPSVSFRIKPVKLDPNTSEFELIMGRQSISYRRGSKFYQALTWPTLGESELKVKFYGLNRETVFETFNGDWALFRALDHARLRQVGRTNKYQLVFSADAHRAEYDLMPDSIENPFRTPSLLSYHCPETL